MQNRYSGVFGWIEKIHTLHFGKIGSTIAGSNALLFGFLLIVGGLYLLLPILRAGVSRLLRLDFALDGRAWHMNLHRTTAFYAAPMLLLIAFTGAPQALPWLERLIYSASQSEMTEVPDVPWEKGTIVSLESVVQKARALAPGAREILAHVPPPGKAYEVYIIAADAPHGHARSYLFVDPRDGRTLSYTPYDSMSLGAKIFYWCMALHTGEFGGLLWRTLLCLAGLAVTFLAFSGLKSFLGGIAQRKAQLLTKTDETPTLAVIVESIREETDHIKQLRLVAADGSALPIPTAGAHIDLHLGHGIVRQYSLINGPDDRHAYDIAVRIAPDSLGGSRAVHEKLQPGDLLTISVPRNHFPLVQGASEHVLIAGGIGITPLLSMARHLLDGGSSFKLEYFTRDRDRTAFRNLLESPEFDGKVRFHHGIALEEMADYVRRLLPTCPTGAHAYVCGGGTFVTAVEQGLETAWPADHVHREHFSADPLLWSAPRRAFDIKLARSGHVLTVPANRTIAQALAENGYPTMTSCEQGVCGTCLTRVVSGTPEHRDAFLSEKQKCDGKLMMICVSRAQDDCLTLDL